MKSKKTASTASVLDLRRRMFDAFPSCDEALVNLIDAITLGPRIASPSELVHSPICGYQLSSIYAALRRVARQTPSRDRAERRTLSCVLKRLRRARRLWLEQWGEWLDLDAVRVDDWNVYVLDATAAPRPKAPTVRRGFAHGVGGMHPGHALSVLARRTGPGSWTVPLEIRVVPVDERPASFGAQQILAYIGEHGWAPDDLLTVDADYTKAPTLKAIFGAGANTLGRISGRRTLYEPPPPPTGKRGRPRVRGRKIKLWDQRTLPEPSCHERVTNEEGRRFEISRFDDVRMRVWPTQPLVLYRVIEYRKDGTRRYRRPMWLIYVGESRAPTPRAAQAAYAARFSIEHALRFLKGELGLVAGRFSSADAVERLALWVELVASAMWQGLALRADLVGTAISLPTPTHAARLTPGAVRRAAVAIFLQLGLTKPSPVSRGKSPGRAKGTRFEPRKRHRIFRKRKRRKAA
jgi:hypothetical protein